VYKTVKPELEYSRRLCRSQSPGVKKQAASICALLIPEGSFICERSEPATVCEGHPTNRQDGLLEKQTIEIMIILPDLPLSDMVNLTVSR
jgi:hypothetical protein